MKEGVVGVVGVGGSIASMALRGLFRVEVKERVTKTGEMIFLRG